MHLCADFWQAHDDRHETIVGLDYKQDSIPSAAPKCTSASEGLNPSFCVQPLQAHDEFKPLQVKPLQA